MLGLRPELAAETMPLGASSGRSDGDAEGASRQLPSDGLDVDDAEGLDGLVAEPLQLAPTLVVGHAVVDAEIQEGAELSHQCRQVAVPDGGDELVVPRELQMRGAATHLSQPHHEDAVVGDVLPRGDQVLSGHAVPPR